MKFLRMHTEQVSLTLNDNLNPGAGKENICPEKIGRNECEIINMLCSLDGNNSKK